MALLFWLLFIIDLLICLLAVVGKGFRDSYSASNTHVWFILLLFGGTFGGLLVRLVFRKALLSLALVALPLLVLLVWYLIDTKIST